MICVQTGGLVFFSFWVLLGSSGVLLAFDNTEERQKNPEERQKNPEERQKRETAAMSVTAVKQPETTNGLI